MLFSRRAVLAGLAGAWMPAADPSAEIGAIERRLGGRLGVAALDTGSGRRVEHRANERFAMCSTFKFLLVAAVLQRVDHHEEKVDRTIAVPPKPLIGNSPLTEPHAGGSMTVAELCEAALIRSDNYLGR